MQINSIPASNSHLPWPSSKIHYFFTSYKQLKPLSFSLKASSFEAQDPKLTIPARLPVTIRRSGSVFQYSWDGNQLKLISLDKRSSLSSSLDDFEDGYKRLFKFVSLPVRNFFLPREISGNYVEYVKWKFLHRVFSSALQVLATQAMFRAIGIGYAHSLPSAAALNWVLKDGLGRLSRCIYTACLASAFDTNLKRVRFSTSVVFSLSVGLELLTPAFPQYFLLLASVANIAKQISLACYLATSSAVHRSFAIADNLGEVSAKAQIQSVSFDNLGLLLAASLNMLFKNSPRLQAGLPFAIYPVFTAIDLFGIYQGLKHVHLQTLTKDRLEIILNTWIEVGYIPSPAEVSNAEGIDFLSNGGRELWNIRIGCLNTKSQIPMLSMMTVKSLKNEDLYFICMEISQHKLLRKNHLGILLCVREGAQTADVILGLLQACYLRKRLLCSATKWDTILEACHKSDLVLGDWFSLVEDSKHSALANFDLLKEKLVEAGWASKNILLSTKEQARYSFLDDPQG
ncbi:hypothetical protein DCAR_0312424 [Daucus carota subsp. sativus]|uniref:Protein root UVB sensitive/RUS domain-containing protein n=2 Tax=Daucus carota subsp. sativus TaxID=79200 RepID=A0A166B0E2_DAUCS|nr:PREDICTED: protein root UVB sensitive 4 isoform X1 [Daucus carota subsp. sativus]WOG93143.1 hypothetical protein DCAR_0312424 [Daucus carota subsp. sativus]